MVTHTTRLGLDHKKDFSVTKTQQIEKFRTTENIAPVKISLGISKHKHFPCLKMGEQFMWPWEYSEYRKIEKIKLALTSTGISMTKELLNNGHFYLPKFSLEGKIVLDIGACCGESADIFLRAGAKKVVCIEPDMERVKYIEFNKKNLGWDVEVIAEKAKPKHILETQPDMIKCDIEGYEMDLIEFLPKYPCVLEVHNHWIRDRFAERGFNEITPPDPMIGECLMANKSFLTP